MLNNEAGPLRTIEDNIINFTKSGKSMSEMARQLKKLNLRLFEPGKALCSY